jgi:hypothetical protein
MKHPAFLGSPLRLNSPAQVQSVVDGVGVVRTSKKDVQARPPTQRKFKEELTVIDDQVQQILQRAK